MRCAICKRDIMGWETNHNATPVTEGRCCDECNDGVVLPIRRGSTVMKRFRDLYKLEPRKGK